MATTTNLKNAWRSSRLVYRSLILPEDEGFLIDHINDPLSQSLSSAAPLAPPNRATLERHKKGIESCLLALVICLPISTSDDTPATSDGVAHTESRDAEEAKAEPTRPPKTVSDWHERQSRSLTPIGMISLSACPPHVAHLRVTSIGINIAEPYQSKGYGGEAITWITDWAFAHAGMHRVEISAAEFNERAVKLYQRLGFVEEGRKRKVIWLDGGWWDAIEMGMLEEEWRKLRGRV